MNNTLYGRIILSHQPGATVTGTLRDGDELPQGIRVFSNADVATDLFLAPPFQSIPVLPDKATYRGEIIGVVTGPDWHTVDAVSLAIKHAAGRERETEAAAETDGEALATNRAESAASPGATPQSTSSTDADDTTSTDGATDNSNGSDRAYGIVEGIYQTGVQLHIADAPLWAEATPTAKGVRITVPCQWPAHVRQSVATALRVPVQAVHLSYRSPSGNRDGALVVPAMLAVIAAVIATAQRKTVRVALRYDQTFISGGRAPTRVQWASRLTSDGTVLSNTVRVEMQWELTRFWKKRSATDCAPRQPRYTNQDRSITRQSLLCRPTFQPVHLRGSPRRLSHSLERYIGTVWRKLRRKTRSSGACVTCEPTGRLSGSSAGHSPPSRIFTDGTVRTSWSANAACNFRGIRRHSAVSAAP